MLEEGLGPAEWPDDPNLALIVVDVDEAKWWDGMEAKALDLAG